eukprot:TRINITY_DN171_c2_g2_i1.p1 TRINITY_DN171_c2_g2~~TRINITY_DN171_c2_g2_i1.p1  ORF type:complete len:270 (+),score=31.07 TRINITY_DN171_c2_g2_i1:195-1004(+)
MLPPVLHRFREGVNENAQGEEKIEIAKQFFKEYISSMHTGKVRECFEAWMDAEGVWTTERERLTLRSKGVEEAVRKYNTVVDKMMGGPQSTVSFRVNNITYHSKLDVVKLDFVISVLRVNESIPTVEPKRYTIKFNERLQILRIVVSPPDETAITPVKISSDVSTPISNESSTQSDSGSSESCTTSPLLRSPSRDRPCLHNNWDPVRVKRRHALLRCRVCASQWKIPVSDVTRCYKFVLPSGCSKGSLCTSLHVNARKQTYEERVSVRQ